MAAVSTVIWQNRPNGRSSRTEDPFYVLGKAIIHQAIRDVCGADDDARYDARDFLTGNGLAKLAYIMGCDQPEVVVRAIAAKVDRFEIEAEQGC